MVIGKNPNQMMQKKKNLLKKMKSGYDVNRDTGYIFCFLDTEEDEHTLLFF